VSAIQFRFIKLVPGMRVRSRLDRMAHNFTNLFTLPGLADDLALQGQTLDRCTASFSRVLSLALKPSTDGYNSGIRLTGGQGLPLPVCLRESVFVSKCVYVCVRLCVCACACICIYICVCAFVCSVGCHVHSLLSDCLVQ
jgi:hypothetical protein